MQKKSECSIPNDLVLYCHLIKFLMSYVAWWLTEDEAYKDLYFSQYYVYIIEREQGIHLSGVSILFGTEVHVSWETKVSLRCGHCVTGGGIWPVIAFFLSNPHSDLNHKRVTNMGSGLVAFKLEGKALTLTKFSGVLPLVSVRYDFCFGCLSLLSVGFAFSECCPLCWE